MILAIDAGGTHLRTEIYQDKKLLKSLSAKTSENPLSLWIESILKEHENIKTISISYAGQVKDGVILSAPNITIDKHDIKSYFEEKYNVEFFIQNDLNCAVLAESLYFKTQDICAIYVGTGLGLGVISGSNIITGSRGVATELGHIPYKETPFRCGCGKNNCIELYASGNALGMWKNYHGLDDSLTLKDLKNNTQTKAIYQEFEEALLHGVACAITLFNPKIVVLGGGIINENNELSDIISTRISKFVMPAALDGVTIVSTKLKNGSLQGALMLGDGNG